MTGTPLPRPLSPPPFTPARERGATARPASIWDSGSGRAKRVGRGIFFPPLPGGREGWGGEGGQGGEGQDATGGAR
jgi:hypothetical protein